MIEYDLVWYTAKDGSLVCGLYDPYDWSAEGMDDTFIYCQRVRFDPAKKQIEFIRTKKVTETLLTFGKNEFGSTMVQGKN